MQSSLRIAFELDNGGQEKTLFLNKGDNVRWFSTHILLTFKKRRFEQIRSRWFSRCSDNVWLSTNLLVQIHMLVEYRTMCFM